MSATSYPEEGIFSQSPLYPVSAVDQVERPIESDTLSTEQRRLLFSDEPLEADLFSEISAALIEPNTDCAVSGLEDTVLEGDTKMQYSERDGSMSRAWDYVKEKKTAFVLGVSAMSIGATAVNNPVGETLEELKGIAPWVGAGVGASEAAFIGGTALMVAAVRERVPKNPLKIRGAFDDIKERANDSALFQTGFWVNTAGAVGTSVVPSVAVVGNLPKESWGVLSLTTLDLMATVALRKIIRKGVKEAGDSKLPN